MSAAASRGVRAVVLAATIAVPASARAFEWRDLLRTPDERAAATLDSDARSRLVDERPESEWAAHARYRDGNVDAALAGFAARLAAEDDPEERHRLRYNRATALVRAGRPEEAIEAFDELLEARPDDADAAANRDIARRLLELREEARRHAGERPDGNAGEGEGEGEDGESGGESGGESADEPGEPGGEPAAGGSKGAGGSGRDAAGAGGPGGDREGGAGPDEGDAEGGDIGAEPGAGERPTAAQQAAATAALDAGDTGDAPEGGNAGDAVEAPAGAPADAPLGEREQAVEQWLGRIPDDPSGLLRGKLLQSHRRDWPDVLEGSGGI